MGIFRQFPYTNFHEMNLDSLIHCCNEMKDKMDHFIVDVTDKIVETVNKWLNDHPEATTTVQDHSLTEIKFTDELAYKTIKDYVTPLMYGAIGDGIVDDTQAFKDAINSGKKVLIPSGTYKLNDYLFADDSVVFENNGLYNNKPFIISKNVLENGISPGYQNQIYLNQYGLIGLQSAVYNPDRDTLILGSDDSNSNLPSIVEINWSTKGLIRSINNNKFSHCNDMTYVPADKTIYIAPMDGNKIIAVDSDLFVFRNDILVDNLSSIHQISYDETNEIFYISDGNKVYAYDKNFVYIKDLSDDHINPITLNNVPYDNIQGVYTQATCVYKGQPLYLGFMWADRGYTSYARISQLNFSVKDETKSNCDIPLLMSDDECEALTVINDELYMFGYCSEALTITKINTTSRGQAGNIIDIFSQATNGPNIAFDSVTIKGSNGIYLAKIFFHAVTDLTAGTSYYGNLSNIPDIEGFGIGYLSDTVITCLIYGGTVNIRPNQNIAENTTFFVTVMLAPTYIG